MTIVNWSDTPPKAKRKHKGPHHIPAPEFKFVAIQTHAGWEVRMLGKKMPPVVLYNADVHQACRLTDALRHVLSPAMGHEDRWILQRIRPKGWKAPLWLEPCLGCDTVEKIPGSLYCAECAEKRAAHERYLASLGKSNEDNQIP